MGLYQAMLALITFTTMTMNTPPADLCKTWQSEYNQGGGWVYQNYAFVKFTSEWQVQFLNIRGEIVESYSFELDDKEKIVLENGNEFGKIVKLDSDSLLLSRPTQINDPNTFIYEPCNYSIKKATKTKISRDSINKLIYSGKWRGQYGSGNKLIDIELKPESVKLNQLTFAFKVSRGGKIVEKSFNGRIIEFEGTYFVEFEIPKMYGAKEWMTITKISKDEIEICKQKEGISVKLNLEQ